MYALIFIEADGHYIDDEINGLGRLLSKGTPIALKIKQADVTLSCHLVSQAFICLALPFFSTTLS